jgi:SpoVK/Ycf46/Vps4 family AAA+-type ATPase
MNEPYESNWDYLSAELSHLNLLIHREVARWRQLSHKDQQEIFRGMFISEGEIEHVMRTMIEPQGGLEDGEARQRAVDLREEIEQRRRATRERGTYLPLPHLAQTFMLTAAEELIILICLAPEIDQRYEKLYAYLQDDVSRKRPSVGLSLKLLCDSAKEALRARVIFSPQASLFRSQILAHGDDADSHLLSRTLKLDERVTNYLLGTGGMEKGISACFKPLPASPDLHALRWPEELTSGLLTITRDYLQRLRGTPRKLIFNFHGPKGTGRKSLAAALCRELDIPLMVIDAHEVLRRHHQSFEDAIHKIFREAVLMPGAIYVDNTSRLLLSDDEQAHTCRRQLARCVEEFSWLTFFGTEKIWEPAGLFKEHIFLSVDLPMPDTDERSHLWRVVAESNGADEQGPDWDDLAAKFRLTPGQMCDALVSARNAALLRGGDGSTPTRQELYRGCYEQSNRRLGASARKLSPRHGWGDIVLPPDELSQLREVCAQLKHRQKVYGEWGFDRKVSLSRGLCVLFYGQSGTGKTMAVEILANELQLEAYKIDLSTVVSKYIGETEKNLSAIFQEAETSNAILFFDEADALFGKRSEVKDAHDRYANIEINYLLQRMEEFEGLVILATNLRKNIDEAFFRRMHFAVEFPFPDEQHRYRIWKQHFPEVAPLADDVDFNFLANRLNVAGGNIKNIVLNAAFLAAENSGVINMKHLVRAARREYEKVGRLCNEVEFSPYHALLRDV